MSEDKNPLEVQSPKSEADRLDPEFKNGNEPTAQESPSELSMDPGAPPKTSTEQGGAGPAVPVGVADSCQQIIANLARQLESQPELLEMVGKLQYAAVALQENQQILTQELEQLQQKLEGQSQETEIFQKRYISLAAEFDNFRKRTAKEKEELEKQAQGKTLTELLAVVDNFERARTQIKPANDGELTIHKSYQGVYKSLVDSLKRLGVSAMRPEGQPFDPTYHEAMLREATDKYPEGTVIEQLVRGYLYGDRVLRHAMVKVAMPPEAPSGQETAAGDVESDT